MWNWTKARLRFRANGLQNMAKIIAKQLKTFPKPTDAIGQ
jgi:hypothetical protein